MKPLYLAAFIALGVTVSRQASSGPPAVSSQSTGLDIDSTVIGKTVFYIAVNNTRTKTEHGAAKRQDPVAFRTISADEASMKTAPGDGKIGVFYRGDSRPPNEVFVSGFVSQGTDKSLQHHLSFIGDSGLVSLSRSPASAERYAFGRSAQGNQKGYIYVVAPKDVPRGYWIPEIFPPKKNKEVGRNREFAVDGNIPGSSISHAFEVTIDSPSTRSKKIHNNGYVLKSSPQCSVQKRAACDPAKFLEAEEPKTKSGNGQAEQPKKTTPGENGHDANSVSEEEGMSKKKSSTNPRIGIQITESRFLQFLSELEPEVMQPLVRAIKSGEVTVADVQLAFKRSLSETMEKRWASFPDGIKIAETLANISMDLFSIARYATPVGFWKDVTKNLLVIAKEINQGKSPEEKLEFANKNINAIVKTWAYTPVGMLNEQLMKESIKGTDLSTSSILAINRLWSYTPIGWLINQIAPVEQLVEISLSCPEGQRQDPKGRCREIIRRE